MSKINFKHYMLMCHALGVDMDDGVYNDQKRYKEFPQNHYRNYFNTHKDSYDYEYIDLLMKLGLMGRLDHKTNDYYYVTALGILETKNFFEIWVKYVPERNRLDKEYIARKIDFYCLQCNYVFGKNNSEAIFDMFKNYFWQNHYMSHTTNDVINKFRRELKRLFPKYKCLK